MPNIKALYRVADGLMAWGAGPFEPSIPQIGDPPANDPAFAIAVFGDVAIPDGHTKRVTGVVTNGIHQLRDATAAELAAIDRTKTDNATTAMLEGAIDCVLLAIGEQLKTLHPTLNPYDFREKVRNRCFALCRAANNRPKLG